MTLINVSVRELVAFVLRSGSLPGNRFVSSSRAVEGTFGHQQVQGLRPPSYQTEVAVSHFVEVDGLTLQISGRIDGLLADGEQVLIEEIKTVRQARRPDAEENPLHWAQAKVYAHIVAVRDQLEEIQIQLTYLSLNTGELTEERRTFSRQQLADFFGDMVARYLEWARRLIDWRRLRDGSISELTFPYPQFRKGQRQLALTAYRTIVEGRRLYAQAPTGIGKTVSMLYAAIKSLTGVSGSTAVVAEKVFYLTAKTSGRLVAEKTLAQLEQIGLRCKSLTLTARDKVCFKPENQNRCEPEQCEFAIGYYDRVNGALKEILELDRFNRETIEQTARRHDVCPFELSMDLTSWADIIICDYNYLFDPRAYLRRFFQNGGGQFVLLIDEAHNLVDRAREMFSAELNKRDLLALKRKIGGELPALKQRLKRLNDYLLDTGKRCQQQVEVGADSGKGDDAAATVAEAVPGDLLSLLQDFADAADTALSRRPGAAYHSPLLEFYYQAVGFLRVADLFDDHYTYCVVKEGRNVQVQLLCLDPSRNIREALKRGSSALFFSATLTPPDYFRNLLGGDPEDELLELASPFPVEHLHLAVADQIATTYRKRADSYDEVAASIGAVIQRRTGNYMAYFPSYRYMEAVVDHFVAVHGQVDVHIQRRRMSELEREQFLALFDAENACTTVGFAVMGGLFGEGVDLVGERLVGAIIVGVGLPQICLERDLIRAYYSARQLAGFEYAYTFPGMNRVLQAAGRVIRSETDRGVVLLIDQRFSQQRYRRLFPAHWHPDRTCSSVDEIGESVERFWNDRATKGR